VGSVGEIIKVATSRASTADASQSGVAGCIAMPMTDHVCRRTIATIPDYGNMSPLTMSRTVMKPGGGVTPKRPPPYGHSDVSSHTFGPARWIATPCVYGICGMYALSATVRRALVLS